jgi:hypothetical protein
MHGGTEFVQVGRGAWDRRLMSCTLDEGSAHCDKSPRDEVRRSFRTTMRLSCAVAAQLRTPELGCDKLRPLLRQVPREAREA